MTAQAASARQIESLDQTGRQAAHDGRATLIVLLVAAGVRLVLGALLPLVPDEAYYWEWSRRLSSGYFDHPPAIALLVRGGTALLGDTRLGVRILPQIVAGLALLATVRLAERLGGPLAARRTALVTAAVPIAAIGLVLATPDSPLLLMASLTLLAMGRAIEAAESRVAFRWWLAAGVCLGLAFLAKYTAVLLPLGALLAMLTHRELRPQLARPGPYAGGVVAIVTTVPVVAWNARHGWASFAFQLHHGLGRVHGSPFRREGDYFGAIVLLATPILCALLVAGVARGLRKRLGAESYLLAATATTWVAFFAYSTLRHRPEPNWAAPALIAATPLIAIGGMSRRAAAWLRGGLALAVALVVVACAGLLAPTLLPAAGRRALAKSFEWRPLAAAVTAARRAPTVAMPNGTSSDSGTPTRRSLWLAAERYQIAAELAFVLDDHPTVFALNLAGRPNQYDYWPGFPARAAVGDDLLVVLEARPESRAVVDAAGPYFAGVTRFDDADAPGYELWLLHGWRGGWPRTTPRP